MPETVPGKERDMKTLKLELHDDATRQHIRAQLFALLDETSYIAIGRAVEPLAKSDGHCHGLPEVIDVIRSQHFDAEIEADAIDIYRILNGAEASVHGCSPDETHFHEVGNHEAIGNVLAVCLAIRALAPERIVATPVQVGKGKVQCAHGLLDIPAPATAAIISHGDPEFVIAEPRREGEWCTPTSAAIIKHYVEEFVE